MFTEEDVSMTDADEIVRAVSAEFGAEAAAELRATIEGGATPQERTRALGVGLGEAAAAVSFGWAVAQMFFDVRAKRRDEAELLADLAGGLDTDPRLLARLDPQKRLSLASRVLDNLLPKSFGRPTAEQIAVGKAERAKWVESFIAKRQQEVAISTRTWSDVKTRDFVGGATILLPFAEQEYWIVYTPIGWVPDASDGPDVVRVDVPRGFVTDLASVPWYLWSFLNKTGLYGNAAIYHDWLYWQQANPRHVADNVFERAMNDMGVGTVTRNVIYLAVRARGGSYWDDNTRAKAAGELRVLKRFPEHPTIHWADWKKDPDVFE